MRDAKACALITPSATATVTPQHNRVRALNWCPRCFAAKDPGLLVCWPCNTRLKRAYAGHGPMEPIYPALDIYLAEHNDSEAISWLGGA